MQKIMVSIALGLCGMFGAGKLQGAAEQKPEAHVHPQLADKPKSELYAAFDASKAEELADPAAVTAPVLLLATQKVKKTKRRTGPIRSGTALLSFNVWLEQHPRGQHSDYYDKLVRWQVCDEFNYKGIILQDTKKIEEFVPSEAASRAYEDYLRYQVPDDLSLLEWLQWRPKKYFSDQEIISEGHGRLGCDASLRRMPAAASEAHENRRREHEQRRDEHMLRQMALDTFIPNVDPIEPRRGRMFVFGQEPSFEYWR